MGRRGEKNKERREVPASPRPRVPASSVVAPRPRVPASLVAILMGSKSDWETMRTASESLAKFDVPHESHVMSPQSLRDRRIHAVLKSSLPPQAAQLILRE